MATANASGVFSDLVDSGLDIFAESQSMNGAELDIYAGYDGSSDLIFSGVVDECEIDVDENTFKVSGRDHAASLMDGRQTLAGLNYRNRSVAQIVQQIAQKFNFSTDIQDPGIKAGPTMNGENFFNPHSQTYWMLLQSLADNVGYECWVTPDQTLHFRKEQTQGNFSCQYGWGPNDGASIPAWGLKVTYSPRNNSNITIKAISQNLQSTEQVIASATAKPIQLKLGKSTKTSITGGKAPSSSKGSSGSKSPIKTVHYIRCAGLTPEQAQAKCQAMADDLAKHQVTVGLTVWGTKDLKIHSSVNLDQSSVKAVNNVPLNVAEVHHSFTMDEGWVTGFRALGQVS